MQGINLWAVLVAGLAKFFLGFLWYSPALFSGRWKELAGITGPADKAAQMQALGGNLVAGFVMALGLAHAVRGTGAFSWLLGAGLGALVWLAYVAVTQLDSVLFEKRPWALFAINNGYFLIGLVIMGAIIGAWQ